MCSRWASQNTCGAAPRCARQPGSMAAMVEVRRSRRQLMRCWPHFSAPSQRQRGGGPWALVLPTWRPLEAAATRQIQSVATLAWAVSAPLGWPCTVSTARALESMGCTESDELSASLRRRRSSTASSVDGRSSPGGDVQGTATTRDAVSMLSVVEQRCYPPRNGARS